MSSGRRFPIRSFVASVVLVAVVTASVYLSYELVVKPRQVLQDQIREQNATILKLEQEKQRLEAYLTILKHIDRRARIEVLRQAKDQQGSLQTTIRFTEVDDAGKPINASRELTLPGQEVSDRFRTPGRAPDACRARRRG
jgi:E3 ubiquitin-protein ligase DOA10